MIVMPQMGRVGGRASISDQTISDTGVFGVDTIFARYKLDLTGLAYKIRNTVDGGVEQAIASEWLTSGVASEFEVYATLNSGTLSAGTTGSWLSLASQRTWRRDAAGVSTTTVDLTIAIRDALSGSTLDTAHIVLQAIGT